MGLGYLFLQFSVLSFEKFDTGEVISYPFKCVFLISVFHQGAVICHLDSRSFIKVFSSMDGCSIGVSLRE